MKNFLTILLLLFTLLYSNVVLTQEDNQSPVQFHGNNTLVGQYSNMQGIGQEIPPSFFRNDLQMTLSVYDIPISASFFIASEQRDNRQSINNFRIKFDANEILRNKGINNAKDMITSAAILKLDKLKKAAEEFVKSKEILNSDFLNNQNEIEKLQLDYDEAKIELEDAKLNNNEEEMKQASAKVEEAKFKLYEAKEKTEKLKAKLKETKAKIEDIKAKVEQAKEKVKQVKSLVFDSKKAQRKAEATAKKSLMPGFTRFLSNFTTLEIGKCRPYYSDLTLKGIAVSGVNIEFTPGPFYSAFSTGKTSRPIKPDSISMPVYEQNILFGKIGIGKKQGTHFYLTYMQAEDDVNSLQGFSYIDTNYVSPKSNLVIGSELKLEFFKKKFTIEGEAAISMLTRDKLSPELIPEDNAIPNWAVDHFKPNFSSSMDYAYNVKTNLMLKSTKISGGIRMVGAGYNTLGNPNLRNDRLNYDGRIVQTFAKKQISLSVFYKQYRDNLINWKKATSEAIVYGITAGLRFKKAPYFMVTYTPNFMQTANDTMILKNSVRVLTAMTGYNYKIGKMRCSTSFNYFFLDTKTEIDTSINFTKNTTYTINEVLNFKIPLTISTAATFTQSENAIQNKNILILSLNATLSSFKSKWQNSLGVKYFNQDYEQDKLGFFLNSRAQLGKMFDLEIRIEKNVFRDICFDSNNFNEFIVSSTITMKW